jgi:TolB-like protein/tetratricopeptide (TPR) repeat protein
LPEASQAPSREVLDEASPSSSEIQAQLKRILESRDFDVSERDRSFLKYVITETLSGRADQIKAYSIAVDVFGRDASFEPQSDPVVRIEAGRIRRGLERYYLKAGSRDQILITLPKGSYVPVFSYRVEDEWLEAEQSQAATPHLKGRSILLLWGLAAIVFAIAAGMLLQWLVLPRMKEGVSPSLQARGPNIPRLLVEPFENVSKTKDGAIMARGLTVQVVQRLASFKDLVVILIDPRISNSNALLARNDPALRYILSGDVDIDGDDIRLSARLVDHTDGSVLWAESYEESRKVRRWREIETDVAREVATALGQPYGVIFQADVARVRQAPPQDWEAYACTLSYYLYRRDFGQSAHASVKNCLEHAVERFPGYATAWALLSLTYIDEFRFRLGSDRSPQEVLEQAAEAARRAVALNAGNPRALEAQMLSLFFENDVEEALTLGKRAVALNPGDMTLVGEYGLRLALSGKWAEGCPMIAQALEERPGPLGYYETVLALCSYMQRNFQRAAGWIRKTNPPQNPFYHLVATAIYGQLGDSTDAERERQWIVEHASWLLNDIYGEVAVRVKAAPDQAQFLDGLRRANIALTEH